MTERQFIKGINQKTPDAFKHLFEELYASLCFFANRIVNDRELSKDVAARTFMALWEKQEDFEDMNHLRSFAFAVTRNSCITHLRGSKFRPAPLENVSTQLPIQEKQLDKIIDEAEIVRELYSAINKLPDRCRSAFVLTQLEGYSRSEAAERLGISENTVRNQVRDARAKLRIMLGDRKLSLALFIIHCAFLQGEANF